jgi:hypothetical protein
MVIERLESMEAKNWTQTALVAKRDKLKKSDASVRIWDLFDFSHKKAR